MEWILLLAALLLIVANGVFVAAEFSLVTVDRAQVEDRAANGEPGARGVLAGLRSMATQLSGAQLGITVTSLLVGVLIEPSLAAILAGPLEYWGVAADRVPSISMLLALGLATTFQMVFAELFPKNLAIAEPYEVARRTVPIQRAFTRSTRHVVRISNGHANAVLRRMGIEPQEELASARSAEELESLVRRSGQEGTLPAGTADLLERSLQFPGRTAADAMTPRSRTHFVAATDSIADAMTLVRRTGRSRFPVTGPGGFDEIVGTIGLRRMLRVPLAERPTTPVTWQMVPAVVVPGSLALDEVLRTLRAKSHLAIVADEYGGVAGVVTLEDLVEELVGEVADEHDTGESPPVRTTPGGQRIASGLLRPDQLRGLDVPVPDSGAYETLGGFLVSRLGRLAKVGDEVRLATHLLRVTRMDGRRIDEVMILPTTVGPAGAGEGAGGERGARHE